MDLETRETNRRAEQSSCGGDNPETTTIAIEDDDEIGDLNAVREDDEDAKMEEQQQRSSCVIDMMNGGNGLGFVGEKENQRVCRICHLSAKESGKTPIELMELGCVCKGELGAVHSHCAEAWFRIKGNRLCEICGESAKNITGVGDTRFMEEWNESTTAADTFTFTSSSDGSRRCFRGQPLCNFLMACLVIAFVLPWFFRVNMF